MLMRDQPGLAIPEEPLEPVVEGVAARAGKTEEADDAERPTPTMLPLMPRGTARRRRGDADAGVGWVYSV